MISVIRLMVLCQEENNFIKSLIFPHSLVKMGTLIQALPGICYNLEGLYRAQEAFTSLLARYAGGCPSVVGRSTEPVFWQLKRVLVCVGSD